MRSHFETASAACEMADGEGAWNGLEDLDGHLNGQGDRRDRSRRSHHRCVETAGGDCHSRSGRRPADVTLKRPLLMTPTSRKANVTQASPHTRRSPLLVRDEGRRGDASPRPYSGSAEDMDEDMDVQAGGETEEDAPPLSEGEVDGDTESDLLKVSTAPARCRPRSGSVARSDASSLLALRGHQARDDQQTGPADSCHARTP